LKERFDTLTLLRLAASIHVVMHHYADTTVLLGPTWIATAVQRARFSLTLFFVLSGFVISYRYLDPLASGAVTRGDFLRSRFARVFPLYMAAWLLDVPLRIARGVHEVSAFALDAFAHFFMVQAWVRSPDLVSNIPSWTVSTEVAFYLLFPFVVPWFARQSRRRLVTAACALAVVAAIPHVADAALRLHEVVPGTTREAWVWTRIRWPPFRAAEFLIGVALGRLRAETAAHSKKHAAAALLLAASVMIPLLVVPSRDVVFRDMSDAAIVPAGALLVYGLSHVRGRWLPGPLVALGDASYAVYIFQAPVFRNAAALVAPTWPEEPWYFPVYLAFLIAFAYAAHRLLERPANAYLRGR
jgi:peptidoglycan/LPS O-acetylase OafA/YrhL